MKPSSELSDYDAVQFIIETQLDISSADKEANVRLAVKKILSQCWKEISYCNVNCITNFNQLKISQIFLCTTVIDAESEACGELILHKQ